MTPSGPCPIFEGLSVYLPKMTVVTTHTCVEIGSKYGPFDIAMLPIWRGGSLSFVARLGFRVRISLACAPFPFPDPTR